MKKILTVFLVLSIFFVSSCELVNHPDQIDEEGYRVGKKGIETNFLYNTPGSKIYEKTALDVIVEVRNKGKFSEPYGKVLLYGFDGNIMPFEMLDSQVKGENFIQAALPKVLAKGAYISIVS